MWNFPQASHNQETIVHVLLWLRLIDVFSDAGSVAVRASEGLVWKVPQKHAMLCICKYGAAGLFLYGAAVLFLIVCFNRLE